VRKFNVTVLFLIMAVPSVTTALYADNILKNDTKQTVEQPKSIPLVYQMKLVYIFDGDKPDAIINVGNAGFRSVASLKNWAKGLSSGTTIEFQETCRHTDNEPVVMSDKEKADFKDFCKQHNINFIIRPAG
jgi:hypothetical protein